MFGIQDFFRLEGTYNIRYAVMKLPGDLYDLAGLVSTKLPGEPPSVGNDRNWLMVPPKWRRRGVVFEITESYWLSGIGGWPVDVYGDGNGSGRETGLTTGELTTKKL